jgi:hypothetical protein
MRPARERIRSTAPPPASSASHTYDAHLPPQTAKAAPEGPVSRPGAAATGTRASPGPVVRRKTRHPRGQICAGPRPGPAAGHDRPAARVAVDHYRKTPWTFHGWNLAGTNPEGSVMRELTIPQRSPARRAHRVALNGELRQRSRGATTSGRMAARSTAFGPCRQRERTSRSAAASVGRSDILLGQRRIPPYVARRRFSRRLSVPSGRQRQGDLTPCHF